MRSPEIDLDTGEEPRSERGVLYRLLDPMFGLFVWVIHFLVVYVGAAIACVLRADANPATGTMVIALLAAVTLLAAGTVAVHAVRTWRSARAIANRRFLSTMTAGLDALAVLAILWQLFPLLMVPLCYARS